VSEPKASDEPVIYQLRVVLRGISPLIWRRLLVRGDSTLADLHATLQTALGWSDEHLNRFVIHGREYGVAHIGGVGFADDPRRVRLADLGLRVGERFLYEYDFTDGWQHDVHGALRGGRKAGWLGLAPYDWCSVMPVTPTLSRVERWPVGPACRTRRLMPN